MRNVQKYQRKATEREDNNVVFNLAVVVELVTCAELFGILSC